MRMSGRIRRLSRLVPWPTLLLAAACGGGKDGPAGPGDETARYELVSIGRVGLPADVALEDCSLTRFYEGRLEVTDDGIWWIGLNVHDFSGDWGYSDEGVLDDDGTTVWFDSDLSESVYAGTIEGSEVKIMYDWCYNGVPDMQLVFAR
jgi:hypothetical protein